MYNRDNSDELRTTMIAIYALYLAGLPTFGVTLLIGGVLAFFKREEMAGTVYYPHLPYLLRTLAGAVLGFLIIFVFARILTSFLGIFIYVSWAMMIILALWYLYRVGMGFYRLWTEQPVSETSWL